MPDGSPGLPLVSEASAALLLDSGRCPACFTPLAGPRCGRCGLDVTAEGAEAVWLASNDVAAALGVRDHAIAVMRRNQAERDAARLDPALIGAAAGPCGSTSRSPVQRTPAHAGPTPPAVHQPGPAAGDALPRRSGVQILLLVVGVVAVAVAAVFFVFVAYLLASLAVRSLIIALLSAAVLGGAVALRPRLRATAEAIAVLGIVLLLLDLWIVRANDVLGTAAIDARLFAGAGIALVAGVGVILARRARLRAGSVAAAVLLPAAASLAVAGLAPDSTGLWLGGGTAAIVGSVAGTRAGGRLEAVALRAQGVVGLLVSAIGALVALPDVPAQHLLTFGLVAAVAATQTVVVLRDRSGTAAPGEPAPLAGSAAAALSLAVLVPLVFDAAAEAVGAVAAAPVALALPAAGVIVAVRWTGRGRRVAIAVAAGAAVAAVWFLLPAVAIGFFAVGRLVVGIGTSDAFAPAARFAAPLAELGDLAVAAAGLTIVLAVTARLVPRPAVLGVAIGVAAAGALAVGAASGDAATALGCATVVGLAGAGCVGRVAARRPWLERGGVAALVGALPILGVVAVRTTWIWPAATAVAIVALAGTRATAVRSRVRIAASAALVAVVLAAGATFALWLPAVSGSPQLPLAAPPLVLSAAVLVIAAAVPRIPKVERWTTELLALAGALLATVGLAVAAVLAVDPPSGAAAAAAGLALAAVAAVLHLIRAREVPMRPEASPAALLLPLLVLGAAVATADAVPQAPAALLPVAAGAGALLGAVLAALPGVRVAALRPLLDGSALAGTLAAVVAATASDGGSGWIGVLIAATAPLVLAASAGDPLRVRAPRRRFAWAALVLAVLALWQALLGQQVAEVEPYTLPVAGALLAVAALLAAVSGAERTTVLGIAVAGLAIGLLPSAGAVVAEPGPEAQLRGVVVAASAALLVAATTLLPVLRRQADAGVGVLAVAVPALALVAVAGSTRGIRAGAVAETWWVPAGIVLIVAAALLIRRRNPVGGTIALGGAVIVLAGAAFAAVTQDAAAATRLPVILAVLGCAFVAADRLRPGPRSADLLLRLLPLAGAVAVACYAALEARPIGAGAAVPAVELASVPLAAALLAAGASRMRGDAGLRSWPTLGPGLAVLLIPSLLLDLLPGEAWRLVSLGVVALAVMLLGALRGLSAPFLLGGAVLLTHVVAQLWPWISRAYQAVEWWIWIGVAGALLIAVAARYEHRARDLRQAVRLLGGQR